ncbi:class I SAM-dependent methyltransferase [Corynebacterium renale]|uniref:class I SAM-dependent methyltransferase n=1 Tax=Corynebacterium renale TaxID=1724 RepID=UPI000DBE941D|nr:class I SAM-dependent methyltransferase [Corynebacterium renale]
MRTWKEITAANPDHSHNYARRWRSMAQQGKDIYGEARLVHALVQPGSTILDAGCGTGRIAGWLQDHGHHAHGSDVDPVLIDYAREDYPDATWFVGDLAQDSLPHDTYDAIVSAGNVMGFIAPESRQFVVDNLAAATKPGGRVIVGYGSGPGRDWSFGSFLEMAENAGLKQEFLFSSWDVQPFTDDSTFMVALLRKPEESGPAEGVEARPATIASAGLLQHLRPLT